MENSKLLSLIILFVLPITTFAERNLVDRYHKKVSSNILKLSDTIDGFFADSQHSDIENRSKLTIQLDTFVRESKGPIAVPDIDFRLILPRTQKRLRLFVENENQDKRSETSKASNAQTQTERPNDNDSAAGIRYIVEKSGIKFYQDTGVIVSIPIRTFIRAGAKKTIEFKEWILKIHERVKWVNTDGISSDLDFDYDKRLTRKVVLRMVNNLSWNDQDYIIKFENGPSIFQKISKHKALSYHAHAQSVNAPDFIVTNYIFQATYRQRLYKKWLYMDLSPFINFPRERNFHRTPGFLMGFDAVFGHI